MVIRNNLPAVNARRQVNIANEKLKKASQRLSSGYRINSAADDASGLAVSEKLRTQMRGIKQAVRNSQDGINLVQTFEGALNETSSIIQRCKELAMESANGNYDNDVDRRAIQLEYEQLLEEIDQIAETDFNGVVMLKPNEIVEYEDVEVQTPVESESFSPVFDANGNPTLDVESYRLKADYSGDPFGKNGMVAPIYDLDGMLIHTTFEDGSTETVNITLKGFVTEEDGTQTPKSLTFAAAEGNAQHEVSEPVISRDTNANGDKVYTSTKRLTRTVAPIVILEFVTKVTQKTEYLTGGDGSPILDSNNLPVPISKQLETTYEIRLADDSAADYTVENMTMKMRSDTVWASGADPNFSAGDENERYYTSDTNDGSIDHEMLYTKPFSIDSFSSYYFDLHDPRFNGVSNKVVPDKSADGPDKLKLGNYSGSLSFNSLGTIQTGDRADVAYTLAWENRKPVDGVFKFNVGIVGLTNSNGDTNIWPKPEITYITEIITNANVSYEDIDLIIQTGARTKDAVDFTFDYELKDTGDLEADLNCSAKGLGLEKLTLSTQSDANYTIDMLDHALNKVSMVRAGFGAAQNRLEKKISGLTNTNENLTNAESGIRDVDMASEFSEFTKAQVVANAAQSMLAQTMQLPQSILSLLT